MSGVLSTPFRDMTLLPGSPFPASPVAGHFVSVLSEVREGERQIVPSGGNGTDRNVYAPSPGGDVNGGEIDLVEVAYHQEVSEAVMRAHEKQVESMLAKKGAVVAGEARALLKWNVELMGFEVKPKENSPLWEAAVRANGLEVSLSLTL